MARIVHINHRCIPRDQTAPQIINPRTGMPTPAVPEKPFETEEQIQLRKRVEQAENRAAAAEAAMKVHQAENAALKTAVESARHESGSLRKQVVAAKHAPPNAITIVSIDDVERQQNDAIVHAICQVDNVVGEVTLTIPMPDLLRIIKTKKGKGAA